VPGLEINRVFVTMAYFLLFYEVAINVPKIFFVSFIVKFSCSDLQLEVR